MKYLLWILVIFKDQSTFSQFLSPHTTSCFGAHGSALSAAWWDLSADEVLCSSQGPTPHCLQSHLRRDEHCLFLPCSQLCLSSLEDMLAPPSQVHIQPPLGVSAHVGLCVCGCTRIWRLKAYISNPP